MKRILAMLAVSAVLVVSSACSAKKPPEPAAVRTRSAISTLRDLNRSYESKDLVTFMAGVSPSYRDRAALERSIAEVFAKYETIQFTVQYTKMIIAIDAAGQARATFTWEAEWRRPGGLSVKDGARVTLLFDQKENKLAAVEGKNPFIPQPGVTPGKDSK